MKQPARPDQFEKKTGRDPHDSETFDNLFRLSADALHEPCKG
jgi:hypothetical protein